MTVAATGSASRSFPLGTVPGPRSSPGLGGTCGSVGLPYRVEHAQYSTSPDGWKTLGALPALYLLLSTSPPEVIEDPPPAEIARCARLIPAPDAPILAAAIVAQVDYLVTGNTRHFALSSELVGQAGLAIVTPSQLVSLLGL